MMNKKTFWSKLRSPLFPSKGGKSIKDGEEKTDLSGKLNVNEEYKEVLRTQSYAEIWSKVQVQLKKSTLDHKPSSSPRSSPLSSFSNSCSPLPLYVHLSDCLLEPRQEAVIDIIKSSDLRVLLVDYFEASLEAYNVCELLLGGIQKTRSNHRLIKGVIKLSRRGGNDHDAEEGRICFGNKIYQCRDKVVHDLACFTRQSNPLSIILNGKVDFRKIHDKYTRLLQNLTARRRKIKRRQKLTRCFKKVAGYSFVAAFVVLAIVVLALAMHSVVGLLGAAGLPLMASSSSLTKKAKQGKGGGLRVSLLEQLASQLDVAAKGVYILINDFDTVGRLVMRVHDEVEHMRALAEMCVRNNKNQELIKEALRELNVHEDGLAEQLEELEEHIYLCFLTINRSRRLVIQEILAC